MNLFLKVKYYEILLTGIYKFNETLVKLSASPGKLSMHGFEWILGFSEMLRGAARRCAALRAPLPEKGGNGATESGALPTFLKTLTGFQFLPPTQRRHNICAKTFYVHI